MAERQFWFFEWLSTQGVDVFRVAPSRWGRYERSWGYPIVNEGNMADYEFTEAPFRALEDFKPDVVYVQQEAYCRVTAQFLRFAKRVGAKFALFVWDNIYDYRNDTYGRNVLKDSDLVVCGNGRAEQLVKPINENTLRCIQVGVATDVFVPMGDPPAKDVIFQGRMAPEKGYKVLENAARRQHFSVLWPEPNQGSLYADLAFRYPKAKVLAAPSVDTPRWAEQHAGYASLEALSSGLYVATSKSEAIEEALAGCPGVTFSPQSDDHCLGIDIGSLLKEYSHNGKNMKGRSWVHQNYGYDAIANKLLPALGALK